MLKLIAWRWATYQSTLHFAAPTFQENQSSETWQVESEGLTYDLIWASRTVLYKTKGSRGSVSKIGITSLRWQSSTCLKRVQVRNCNYNLILIDLKWNSHIWLEATHWTAHEFQRGPSKKCFERVRESSEIASKIVYVYKCIFLSVHSFHQNPKVVWPTTKVKKCSVTGEPC